MRCRFNGGCGNSHSLAVYEGLASELMMKRYGNIGIDSPTQHLAIVAIAMIERIEQWISGFGGSGKRAPSGKSPEKRPKSKPGNAGQTESNYLGHHIIFSRHIFRELKLFPAISFELTLFPAISLIFLDTVEGRTRTDPRHHHKRCCERTMMWQATEVDTGR